MHAKPPRDLRKKDKLYNCVFLGERSQDAGGPYRESFSMYAQELQSAALPLLLRTPNGQVTSLPITRYPPLPSPPYPTPLLLPSYVYPISYTSGHVLIPLIYAILPFLHPYESLTARGW